MPVESCFVLGRACALILTLMPLAEVRLYVGATAVPPARSQRFEVCSVTTAVPEEEGHTSNL